MLRLKETALTFDDVLLLPDYSEVLPNNVDLTTRLTKNLSLNIPIISSAMDTVTEVDMAIALARTGGMGIIHKNLTIDDQSNMVDKVKRSESGMIQNPITIDQNASIANAQKIMSEYRISGLPVVKNEKLIDLENSDVGPINIHKRIDGKKIKSIEVLVKLED